MNFPIIMPYLSQVLEYDDGPEVVLSEVKDLEAYVRQNSSEDIMRKRQLRMALRALDGQFVRWPYNHVEVGGLNIASFHDFTPRVGGRR